MSGYKLNIDDFSEDDYSLIAIHTSLEDYRLAFFINKKLEILLAKPKVKQSSISDFVDNEEQEIFSRFEYSDEENGFFWYLIQNKYQETQLAKENTADLFSMNEIEISSSNFLLPEWKKVDFFLKVEHPDVEMNLEKTLLKLNEINSKITAYAVDKNQIKSKNNLIF